MPLPPLLVPLLLILGGGSGAAAAWGALGRRLRWRKARRRQAALGDEGALAAAVDRKVALVGVLEGGEVATGFGGGARSIEEPHVGAIPLARPDEPRLRVGGAAVWLEGPLQVIRGTSEGDQPRGEDVVNARRVGAGDLVVAEGVLRRAAEPEHGERGYRDLSFRYVLVPVADGAWPGRPVALCAARPPPALPPLLALAASLGLLLAGVRGVSRVQGPAVAPAGAVAPSASAPSRPPCAAEVTRLLDDNDPWAAAERARSCEDDGVKAEVSWALGDVDEAAAAFVRAREREPSLPLTMSEVQAVTMVDARRGAQLVLRLKADWYKGPQDPSQSQLDCVAARLYSVADGKPSWSDLCLAPQRAQGFYGQSRRSIHHLPAYALHEPDLYVRFQPVGSDDHTHNVGCGTQYRPLEALTDLDCRGNLAATRALFSAIVGDGPRLERELAVVDAQLDELDRVSSRKLPPPPAARSIDDPVAAIYAPGDDLEGLRFDTQKIVAVAAVAAWVARDEARLRRYVPRSEAHARAILEEHLALVEGRLKAPSAAHSPSDYSAVDVEVFQAVDVEDPGAFVERLRRLRYSSPARLQALLAARPAHRAAAAAWVRQGFVPVCRGCGLHELLDAAFRRREAARLTGEQALADALTVVTRKLGAALVRDASFGPVLSLASLIAR